jgi:hypothetical protein
MDRLDAPATDVVRWGLEALLGEVSRLIDQPARMATKWGLSDEDLATVSQYRSILLLALQGPSPDSVMIARSAARLLEFVPPGPGDEEALAEAFAEADFANPAAAADDAMAIAIAAADLGHEDVNADIPAVLVILDRTADLAEHAGGNVVQAHPYREAFRDGTTKFLRDELAGVYVKLAQPKILAAVLGTTGAAAAGLTGHVGAALQWAWSAIQTVYHVTGR